jgi:hypothetical protein
MAKVYCDNCEYQVYQPLGLCESGIYWCAKFDKIKDEWWGVRVIHKVKCKKQNKRNDCNLFTQKRGGRQ